VERTQRPAVAQAEWRLAFEENYSSLLRFCSLIAGSGSAEDLVQECFVRIAPHLTDMDPEAIPFYLRRTTVNLWKNRIRRTAIERRHRPSPPDVDRGETSSIEERDRLWRELIRLPVRQRACLVLRYYEDRSEKETADILGVTSGTVKVHCARALARLRKELADEDRG
jgi:RNA polymerase sigma-70 factor (sigma-E family)